MRPILKIDGTVKGYIEESNTPVSRVFDRNRNTLGSYNRVSDITLDKNGNTIGRGDLRMMLLTEETP